MAPCAPTGGIADDNTQHIGIPRQTSSRLTYSRSWFVRIAEETLEAARSGKYVNKYGKEVDIQDALMKSISNSVHYHPSHKFSDPFEIEEDKSGNGFDRVIRTKFHVWYSTPLNAAKHLQKSINGFGIQTDCHLGILNSASGKTPGGIFYKGTVSTEDCICRATMLYPCLQQYEHEEHHFYVMNNKAEYKDSSSACAIFSPHVPVIREDTIMGEPLDSYRTYSFVSIPPPNAFIVARNKCKDTSPPSPSKKVESEPDGRRRISMNGGFEMSHHRRSSFQGNIRGSIGHTPEENIVEDYYGEKKVIPVACSDVHEDDDDDADVQYTTVRGAMRDRLFRVLSIFVEKGCTDIILNAFGCGVHGNDPVMVATIFKELLYNEFKGKFSNVVFAILQCRYANYAAFTQVFNEASFRKCRRASLLYT